MDKVSVLWVDDETLTDLEPLQRNVEKKLPLSIDFASTISVALGKLKKQSYDVIIVDVYLEVGYLGFLSEEEKKTIERYKRHSGISLVELLLNGHVESQKNAPFLLYICSSYLIEVLMSEYEIINPGRVIPIHKSDLLDDEHYALEVFTDMYNRAQVGAAQTTAVANTASLTEHVHTMLSFPRTFHQLLHDHDTLLRNLQNTIKRTISHLGPNPFKNPLSLSLTKSEEIGKKAARKLLRYHERFLSEIRAKNYDVPEALLNDFAEPMKQVKSFIQGGKMQFVDMYKVCDAIINDHKRFRPYTYPKELLKNVMKEADDLRRLIRLYDLNNLLIRLEESKEKYKTYRDYIASSAGVKPAMKVFPLSNLLDRAVRDVKSFADFHRVKIRPFKNRCKTVKIKGVQDDLKNVFRNILTNAIKYSIRPSYNEDPWIIIRVACIREHLFVDIENWGIQITKDEIERRLIFREGFRSPLARDKADGTGVGLAHVYQVIRDHEGEVIVTSVQEAGNKYTTTFTVKLPLVTS